MRVLYLTDRISHRGGAQHHLLDTIAALAPAHDITVAAAAMDSGIALPEGVHFERVSGLRSSVASDKGLKRLAPLLEWADVVHSQNVMNPTALSLSTTAKTVVTIQDHRVFCPGPGKTLPSDAACTTRMSEADCADCLPDAAYRSRMLSLTAARLGAIQRASTVIVLSKYMADELSRVGIDNTQIIPPPVALGPSKSDPGTGFVIAGRLVHHKGTDLAIEAWRTAATDHPLTLAGLGPEGEEHSDIVTAGWLERSALRTALSDARAVLFPARWQEPYGIVGVEALAMGTPVIAMVRGGMSDWAHTGTISVPPGDTTAMSSAIQSMASDPAQAHALGAAGQRWVAEALKPDALASRIEAVYSELV